MTLQEIEHKLIDGIAAITDKDAAQVSPEQPFPELGIDSLGFVEILVYIEKTFNLRLIAADLTKDDFATIRSLASYISRKS